MEEAEATGDPAPKEKGRRGNICPRHEARGKQQDEGEAGLAFRTLHNDSHVPAQSGVPGAIVLLFGIVAAPAPKVLHFVAGASESPVDFGQPATGLRTAAAAA